MTDKELVAENTELKKLIESLYKEIDDIKAVAEEYRHTAEQLREEYNADVYHRAVEHYGKTSRLILAIEEMSELTIVFNNHATAKKRQNL